MAINVPIQSPNPVQPVNPFPIVDSYLNRQQQAQQAMGQSAIGLGETYNKLRQQKIAQSMEALKSIAELYGAGGPGAVQQYAPTINRVAGSPIIDTSKSQPQNQSSYSQLPSGGGQQYSQPGGVSPYIQASLDMGHPDFTGHLNKIRQLQGQMSGFENQGKYGQSQTQQLTQELTGEKAALDAELAPGQYEKTQQDIRLGTAKPVAEEVSKQGETTTRVGQLRGLYDQMSNAVSQNKPGLSSAVGATAYNLSRGFVGSKTGADIQNISAPMTAALNYELTKRFNEGEASFLMNSMMPKAGATQPYNQDRLQRLNMMIGALESGNDANIHNVASIIKGQSQLPPPTQTQQSQPVGGSKTPQAGQVYKGHVFLGGDPSQASNWKKQ